MYNPDLGGLLVNSDRFCYASLTINFVKVKVNVKKKEVKLFLYLIKRHAMKTYWGLEVCLHHY
jgi:hypothetical protein